MTKKKKKTGPKSRCSKAKAKKARELIAEGFTMKAVAQCFGVSEPTFYKWRNTFPYFEEEVQKGISDFEQNQEDLVRQTFYRKLHGFSYDKKKTYIEKDKNGKVLRTKEEITTEMIPPSDTLLIFEKKNRDPRYKDKKEIDLKTDQNVLVSVDQDDLKKIEALRKLLADKKK